jgi:hypothetical protein
LWGFLFLIVATSAFIVALKSKENRFCSFVCMLALFLANYKYFDRLFLVGGLT